MAVGQLENEKDAGASVDFPSGKHHSSSLVSFCCIFLSHPWQEELRRDTGDGSDEP